jgi:hypothetical protein
LKGKAKTTAVNEQFACIDMAERNKTNKLNNKVTNQRPLLSLRDIKWTMDDNWTNDPRTNATTTEATYPTARCQDGVTAPAFGAPADDGDDDDSDDSHYHGDCRCSKSRIY